MAYIEVDIEEHLNEVSDSDMIKEMNSRGFTVLNKARVEVKADNDGISKKPNDFKRQMCDLLDLGYHVSKQKIIEAIAEQI